MLIATVALFGAALFATSASAARPTATRPLRLGCDEGAAIADGVITIPIEVFKFRDFVEPIVEMCFDGKGPFPMTLDTGAAFSVITTPLAKKLGLKRAGAPFEVRGAGCSTKADLYELEGASVGGVALEGGDVTTVDAPGRRGGGPFGSLGADILSRFGSVKIDFKRETLTLGAEAEGPWLKKVPDPPAVPAPLLKRKPEVTVPMRVQLGQGVTQTVKVKVGSTKPQPWLIDTGSTASEIEPGLVRRAGLRSVGTHLVRTYCSVIKVPEFRATALSIGAEKLVPQVLASHHGASFGDAGTLGAYSLWQFGSVVFDWPGGKLLLGVG